MLRAAVVMALIFGTSAASAACVKDDERITLSGSLARQVFPGPPNYESITKGDAAESYFLLRLDQPSCYDEATDKVYEAGGTDFLNQMAADIRIVQLMLNQRLYEQYRPLLGQKITLTGNVMRAHTGHHKTFYLLDVAGREP